MLHHLLDSPDAWTGIERYVFVPLTCFGSRYPQVSQYVLMNAFATTEKSSFANKLS